MLDRWVLAYRRGELVPFLGSGMSAPACPTWLGFVERLEAEAEVGEVHEGGDASPAALTRRADRAVRSLSRRGRLVEACRVALDLDASGRHVPPQTGALARVPWPLVITTNWDDLYLCSAAPPPLVLGRSSADCQRILASLHSPERPLLWALQGSLQSRHCPLEPERARRLESEIVVGHEQYQRVMNTEPQFRRVFAEVFRKRSLLFLGSGLREDYLMNLFGEIIQALGGGPLPHFAVMRAGETGVDPDFLQSRLNVTVLEYQSHDELPRILERLAERIDGEDHGLPRVLSAPGARVEERFLLDPASGSALVLRRGTLPSGVPRGACLAVSAGRGRAGPQLGEMARGIPALAESGPEAWTQLEGTRFLYRHESEPIYAVAATTEENQRDLRRIAWATEELLEHAVASGHDTVHAGLLSAGPGTDWPPAYSLIQMLRGARRHARRATEGRSASLIVHLLDPSVLLSLWAGRLNVDEVLSCDDVRFWTEVDPGDGSGQLERVLLVKSGAERLGTVAEALGIPREGWSIELWPAPDGEHRAAPAGELWDATLDEIGIVADSTLRFVPQRR